MSKASSSRGPYLLGIDYGTESARVGIFDTAGRPLAFAANGYRLSHPHPGWAEQNPDEWWAALVRSTQEAMKLAGVEADAIAGISHDCTTCTVVAMDRADRVLRPAIMWMDVRAADQARRIAESKHPCRKYNGGGPVSAEWYPSKALWLKERESETYRQAAHIVEATDWLTFRLTGRWTAGINAASLRAYYDRDAGGWPADFYEEIGLGDALEKLPPEVLDLGAPVGGLSKQAAEDLGLKAGTPVAQGPADAWAAQIGLNVVEPGKMALITGSSHVLTGQSDRALNGRGFFGAYTDAVVPGQYTVEGGQVSTGSVLKWYRDNFCRDLVAEAERRGVSAYELLNEQSKELPPGSEGLIVLDYWQGNRTPHVDPEARGVVWGLSLHHTRAHVYRAIQEGICYGTAHILRAMSAAGFEVRQFVACGGGTKSRAWMQMHADATGVPITLTEVPDAAVLGSAVLASVGAGVFASIQEAAGAMVRDKDMIEPDKDRHETYQFYVDAYAETYPRLQELVRGMTRKVGEDQGAPKVTPRAAEMVSPLAATRESEEA
ncbi:MAG: FGGY-family carbohydrate kinase [Candidatus Dormibacteraeota bacterium]|nr:FGGY-family carbohydrate kinase [Candidatus Dormibacteraeota bacterium]